MNFTISCPSCQRTLRVPESLLGQAVKCPSCEHQFTAPEHVEEEAPVSASRHPAAPPPEDEYDEEPRPSKRRPPDDDYDDDEAPRRRRRDIKPGKVQGIGIMVLIGGIMALLWVFGVNLWAGIATFGICCIPGIYSLILGIMAIIKGAQLLGDKAYLQPPPTGIGVMMIVNIINGDVINLVLGILVLVFLGDREVKDYFRS